MEAKELELARAFRKETASQRKNGHLADSIESSRNGRRVLAVPTEHKRKVRGIIHDESATGRTVFIEPESAILINNDLYDLMAQRKQEIYRLLEGLSARLREIIPDIKSYQYVLVRLDMIQAKASLALNMDAEKPVVKDKPLLGVIQGLHPLLYLKNKSLNKKTVPFDLALHGQNRILVISGPNAGGKSITMKAMGLMQLMVQSSMLVPVDKVSEFGIFRKVFTDIGDQQSIEDDLSTYSSRLRNMNNFIRKADKYTLVLIDEFGSGTDPKIGGAIAEALLRAFNAQKVMGVITTHYPNLKIYAFRNRGILNGAMVFDKENLAPTYRLKIGQPGSSYAFEIAKSSGLSDDILQYARKRTGKNERETDDLLIALQREKLEVEEKLAQLKAKEKEVDILVRSYSNMKGDLDYKRRKIKLEAKEKDLQQAGKADRELQNLIRKLREEKNIEKAKKIAEKIKRERKDIAKEVGQLNEAIYEATETQAEIAKLAIGGYAKFRASGATGIIEDIRGKKAVLLIGEMKVTAKIADLVAIQNPSLPSVNRTRKNLASRDGQFESKIDIRGMSIHDALFTLEKFVDNAILKDTPVLRILHGKGTGALRKAVRQKLKEYGAMLVNIYHPEEELGGNGVTMVEL
ncbi:MAG TPA: endonuclease MutS2 [Saprospiraceae bacterium]|nr:endonuclease MutS2 [Saprospiraceae bacterium]